MSCSSIPIVDVSCVASLCADPRFYRKNASCRYNKKDLSSVRDAVIEHLYEQITQSETSTTRYSKVENVKYYKEINAFVDPSHYKLKPNVKACSDALYSAFHEVGFSYISRHPVDLAAQKKIDELSREFFANSSLEEKMHMSMPQGGKAWRGYFPVGGELTSGKPDIKEGIYFGQKIDSEHDPRATQPLYGESLYPTDKPQTASQSSKPWDTLDKSQKRRHPNLANNTTTTIWPSVIDPYLQQCEATGQALMLLLAIALELPSPLAFIVLGVCDDPLGLFRIFHYPPPATLSDPKLRDEATLWGVGEHTDYGLLTLLKQDNVGGLEVRHRNGSWIPAPPIEGTLVVNVGDMLEAITKGLLLSTPHRVRNPDPKKMRISFPYFFDPCVDFVIRPLPLSPKMEQLSEESVRERKTRGVARWDSKKAEATDVNSLIAGEVGLTYGTYLLRKVSKVFPMLAQSHL